MQFMHLVVKIHTISESSNVIWESDVCFLSGKKKIMLIPVNVKQDKLQ